MTYLAEPPAEMEKVSPSVTTSIKCKFCAYIYELIYIPKSSSSVSEVIWRSRFDLESYRDKSKDKTVSVLPLRQPQDKTETAKISVLSWHFLTTRQDRDKTPKMIETRHYVRDT